MTGPNRAIVLIGPRGVGKTTVGAALAARLGRPFVDLDREIEREAAMTVAEIFAREGEPGFRDREARALAAAFAFEDAPVIATGGGVVVRKGNRELLRSSNTPVVLLLAEPGTLAARLQGDAGAARPALAAGGPLAEATALLATRLPLYREVATVEVETEGLAPDEVVASVARLLSPRV